VATSDFDTAVPSKVRQERLLALVRDQEFMRVSELCSALGVSAVTIRSDLEVLSAEGRLVRFRGGAAVRTVDNRERSFEIVTGSFAAEKKKIGHRAVAHLSSGKSLILDVGTTTTAVARALATRDDLVDLHVFTSALNIAMELEPLVPRISVVVLGGTLRPLQHSLVDPFGSLALEKLNTDFLFLGCNGVHPLAGITNNNAPECDVKRRMMMSARKKIVVADGSKIGAVLLVHLCGVEEIDLLITDQSADREVLGVLSERGLKIEIAS